MHKCLRRLVKIALHIYCVKKNALLHIYGVNAQMDTFVVSFPSDIVDNCFFNILYSSFTFASKACHAFKALKACHAFKAWSWLEYLLTKDTDSILYYLLNKTKVQI